MTENNKKRNGIVTTCLWLGILGYLTITVLYIVTMYSENSSNTVLGLGLCSMLALADALGILLIIRWSKNGFYLLVLSSILSGIVYYSVLKLGLYPSSIFLIGFLVFLGVLQLRTGGKSVRSQLNKDWDYKHCRHIYQIFAVVEVILFVLTLVAFGNCQDCKEASSTQVEEYSKLEPQQRTSTSSQARTVDSLHQTYPKEPEEQDLKPIASEKETTKKSEKPITESPKESDTTRGNKETKSAYDLSAAAKYLDSHDVWNASEMSKYDDLRDLNQQLIMSIHRGWPMLPHDLCRKSKRLQQIERLLFKYDHLCIKQKDKSHIKFPSSTSGINYYNLINSIKDGIHRQQRLNKINKEIDEYNKLVSDSVKNATPTFGLG